MNQTHIIERAFQMADDPVYGSLREIRLALSKERYGVAALSHLDGEGIRRQLRSRISARRTVAA